MNCLTHKFLQKISDIAIRFFPNITRAYLKIIEQRKI